MANNTIVQSLSGQSFWPNKAYIGANSVVFKRGDFVALNTSGFLALATAGNPILGTVSGCQKTTKAPKAMDSTPDQWTMTSDNQTVAKDEILVNVDPTQVVEIDFSADVGTTGGSVLGARYDLTDKDTVNEATAGTVSAQVALVETVPSVSRARVVIVERQLG